ncbi:putative furcatin hydrolase-like [Capsicum annuum]|uniref:Zinc finger PHD-type domain-containing protein n=2 Tax=Capsicum annuum TaxID=4072 RepID=A0A2G3ALL5_CAPAN|nr:putative furcatin hydrolase-like [Capsicum annuum]KAF3639373.1 putative furcatin hydrolase-like [Capsicum annuum]PHT95124.1 hypothetical protein T459_03006 [Capsicum annuum]
MGREKHTACESKQHFSHPHILKLINPAESATLTCNACEKTNITNKPNFYGCNSCQYFLHENCLNVPRFLDHSSHPSHHLTLLPLPTYSSRSYTCDACGSNGNGFSFSCARCNFDIHMHCALSPQTAVLSQHHLHELKLIFESPFDDENTDFVCDLCQDKVDLNNWLYYCADCDFGAHIKCASPDPSPTSQQRRNNVNANWAVEMINSVSDDHDRLVAAQIESQIAARSRQAMLDLW